LLVPLNFVYPIIFSEVRRREEIGRHTTRRWAYPLQRLPHGAAADHAQHYHAGCGAGRDPAAGQ
jgi:hypothetical protein